MDLFDEAMNVAPLTARTASQQAEILDQWGVGATLNEEPEPALPSTDGAEDEEEDVVAARLSQVLSPRAQQSPVQPHRASSPLCPRCQYTFAPGDDIEMMPGIGLRHKSCLQSRSAGLAAPQRPETPAERGQRLLAYAEAVSRGEQPPGPNPFEHLTAGQADNEVAAAASNFLATKGGLTAEALKSYSPAERQQIIEEGTDVTASNLDRLDITGTHYEALEASSRTVPEDEDLTFLDGDPNLTD